MIFVLDNYDSFTYNLVHLLYSLEVETIVKRNREISVDEVLSLHPDGILLSPGPGRPENAGIMPDLLKAAIRDRIPVLGVCLGHQAIGQAFGMKVIPARQIVHGKLSRITHDRKRIFSGIRNPFQAVRYHSLVLDESTLPEELEISARTDDGEIMGIRHKTLPIEGIQYHPESILTTSGAQQITNFLEEMDEFQRKGVLPC